METTGKLIDVRRTLKGRFRLTFEVDDDVSADINRLADKLLSIKAIKFRNKRSNDANKMLWACIGQIAEHAGTEKWDVYLLLLKRYGKYTYICAKPEAVESVKAQWRETEVVGDIVINGKPAVQMLVYFGSSTYNTAEFSKLLNGTISEMEEMGLTVPAGKDLQTALEAWRKKHG